MTVKIQCACGQPYSFEVEPVEGRMPGPVQCPSCGADGTTAANEIIARSSSPPGLRISTATTAPPTLQPHVLSKGHPQPGPVPSDFRPSLANTQASNEARLSVNWGKVFAAHPGEIILAVGLVIAGLAAGLQVPAIFLVFGAGAVFRLVQFCRLTQAKFTSGDVCPGLVISEKPPLVAVMTDMSVGDGRRPVIKILRQPLDKMTGGRGEVGMRVATAALYAGPITGGAWKDFMPEVVGCLVSDQAQIQRVTQSISEPEWNNLEDGLSRLPVKSPGLYRMWGSGAAQRTAAALPLRDVVVAALIVVTLGASIIGGITVRANRSVPLRTPLPPAARRFDPETISRRDMNVETRPRTPAAATPDRISAPPRPSPSNAPLRAATTATTAAASKAGKVEILWGGKWWPGSIVKQEGQRSFVHYDGWPANSDEWVTSDRVRPAK